MMTHPLARQVQGLGGHNERVLVMLRAAQLQNDDGTAAPGDVADLFRDLHVTPPSNERQHLAQLRKRNLVMQPRSGRWAVTPSGEEEIGRLMGELSVDELVDLGKRAGEPEFAGASHHRIDPTMAPAVFQRGISEFQRNNPGERNVFLMVRYPQEYDTYPTQSTIDVCRAALSAANMVTHLAADSAVDDQLFPNVGIYLWSCDFGVAVLEQREGLLNYNVVLETGAMLMTGRRCLLLKDRSVKRLPGDLIAHIHQSVDLDRPKTIETAIRDWVANDLRLA